MDQDRQPYDTCRIPTQCNKKIPTTKNVAQVWKITIFDRQTALFNGASMEAITY
jgi:hypothetical protein